MAEPSRLTDRELWRGVEVTVRDVLLPAIGDEWARAAAIQLVGVARYAQRRPDDPSAERLDELIAALDRLASNPLVPTRTDDEAPSVLAAAAAALVAAVGDAGAAGDEVRAVLRPVLLAHLDAELDVTAPLVDAFRGKLDE
ncbi:MAG: hypothetical protein U0Q03_08225 [Acidimicrobiales bacterium]